MKLTVNDFLSGHGIGSGIGRGGNRVEVKAAQFTLPAPTATVSLPMSLEYDPSRDMMMAFQNSIFLDKGADYTVAMDGTTITSTTGDWEAGTIFDLIVLSNTKEASGTYEGAYIGDGTITEEKLVSSILYRIEASSVAGDMIDLTKDLERMMNGLLEVGANTLLHAEATNLITAGQSFGGNGGYTFGVDMDLTQTATTNILDAGQTILTGKVAQPDAFSVGQAVTIYDDLNAETVIVTKSTSSELEVSALVHGYKSGAVLARSTLVPDAGGGYVAPTWGGEPGPGIARFMLGTTDVAMLGATHVGATTGLRSRYGVGDYEWATGTQEKTDDPERWVTQWVMTNETALPLELELTLGEGGKLEKYLGAIG